MNTFETITEYLENLIAVIWGNDSFDDFDI